MSTSIHPDREKKERRNISLDRELDDWLSSDDVENASALIEELLLAYRAYGGDKKHAAKYVRDRQEHQSRR